MFSSDLATVRRIWSHFFSLPMKNYFRTVIKSPLAVSLWRCRHLVAIVFGITFVGCAIWQHAVQSKQPPIYDAATYYQKAHNFWADLHQEKAVNPLDVEPSFRPPGTILMSYPFGFDSDYRGFYFRSIFLPIALFGLAAILTGYSRDLDSTNRWFLVLLVGFLLTLPAFYYFEVSAEFPTLSRQSIVTSHWGLVDNFFGGVAALAAAAVIRSVWSRSWAWLGLAALLASFSMLIKPVGAFVMVLIGVIWFGLAAMRLRSAWQFPEERKHTIRWLLLGLLTFGFLYLTILIVSFSSGYLSSQNLAYASGAAAIMQTELQFSWRALTESVRTGLGYPFVAWLILTAMLVGNRLYRMQEGDFPWDRPLLSGLAIAACITFAFGIWLWIFGSGGIYQIRYFIPFVLMAVIFALPVILRTVQEMSCRTRGILSLLMIAPIVNMGMLLPQRAPSIEWQQWTGVNLTSGVSDEVVAQAQGFVGDLKREGRNATVYSISMNVTDADFQAVFDYAQIETPSMPALSIRRPVDWQRPTVFRKEEMLQSDYWLFEPMRDPRAANAILATSSIDVFEKEIEMFQAWATQLTTNDGVSVVSETPTARILRINDSKLLESAFDKLTASHHWRNVFTTANPKRRLSEKDLMQLLVVSPPILENVDFSGRFRLRALSASRTGNDTTVRIWWKPLTPVQEHDWIFFIHSIDGEGKIVLNNQIPIHFDERLSSLDEDILFDQITFKNLPENGAHRLAAGFFRPDHPLLIADKGVRDWNNSRVIVTLP